MDMLTARLNAAMQAEGETSSSLARRIKARGLITPSQQTLHAWMLGRKTPSLKGLAHVAVVLGVSMDWFVGLSEKKDFPPG